MNTRALAQRSLRSHAGEWLLIGASLAFLAAYAAPILWPGLSGTERRICSVVTAIVWAIFIAEYLVRLLRADDRRSYFTHHLFDLAILVIPMLRPLRLLRLITVLSVMNRAGTRSVRGRVVVYAVGGAMLLLIVSSLAVTEAERGHPGANINGVGDGLWWSITTMTTVGYGDRVPETVTGRLIAAVLMISGIALLGVVTAFVASWLMDAIAETEAVEEQTYSAVLRLTDEVARLREEVADLRAESVSSRRPASATPPDPDGT
ncbi:MAG: potassium channel family protein [Gordonia sp. (in: high G+C Gram-positive bacteria)]|uniref:potassium channel family protein n=1 Tax=Gordonia sp. (in: high G+C Gram-positive bacteria) TaxID=84139 RepID=UPI0039E410F1